MLGDRQYENVIADDMCDLYRLKKSDFEEVLEDYPEVKEALMVLAAKVRDEHKKRSQKSSNPAKIEATKPERLESEANKTHHPHKL